MKNLMMVVLKKMWLAFSKKNAKDTLYEEETKSGRKTKKIDLFFFLTTINFRVLTRRGRRESNLRRTPR